DAWVAVGGMDETFAVTFNDVDLCLRLASRGWRTLYQPAARLIHLESQTRTPDHRPENCARRDREVQAFLDRWAATVADDPSWSPALTRADESGRAREALGEAAWARRCWWRAGPAMWARTPACVWPRRASPRSSTTTCPTATASSSAGGPSSTAT